VITLANNRGRR